MDAARIAAPGIPITLLDGRTVHLRFGFRGIMRAEEEFGGLMPMLNSVGAASSGVDALNGPMFTSIVRVLACGLLHEHDGSGAPLTRDRLADLLDVALLKEYATAAGQAIEQAFPTTPPAPAGAGVDVHQLPEPTAPSPGLSGTTSGPSGSDALTVSSGA